jgi:transcription initiation factor IIE alpha subunit
MEMCSHFHVEIVHDERECPLCEAASTIEDLEGEVQGLEKRAEELESELDDALSQE